MGNVSVCRKTLKSLPLGKEGASARRRMNCINCLSKASYHKNSVDQALIINRFLPLVDQFMQFLSRQQATAPRRKRLPPCPLDIPPTGVPFTKRSLRKRLLILYRYFFDKLSRRSAGNVCLLWRFTLYLVVKDGSSLKVSAMIAYDFFSLWSYEVIFSPENSVSYSVISP